MKVIYKTTNYEKSEMIVWVYGRIEIVGMIEYAEMKSLHKMKKVWYGNINFRIKIKNRKLIELKSAHD